MARWSFFAILIFMITTCSVFADICPTITTQPVNNTVCSPNTATFTIAATGIPDPIYQWYNSSGSISGATSTSYTTGTADSYYCVANNDCGSATSNTAVLTVNNLPLISTHPQSQNLCSASSLWAWGDNSRGQLGIGDTTARYSPVQEFGLSDVTAIATGWGHTIALQCDGTVWTWGYNDFGQLGIGNTTSQYSPVKVPGLLGVTAVAGGWDHTIALKNDGTVWTWGYNYWGQLGIGNTINQYSPVQVPGLSGVTTIVGGSYYTIALKSDGTVWTWGDKQYSPVQVTGLSGVTAIAGGYAHKVALKSDGTVWAWGYNYYGQIGIGNTTDQDSPVQVPSLSGVAAVACGQYHTVASKSDGTIWAWGYNFMGQLGVGNTTDQHSPAQVPGLTEVAAIAAGAYHTIALKNDGTVWTWGYNYLGDLGIGSVDNNPHPTPVQVSGLSDITAIAGGYDYTIALENGPAATLSVIDVGGTSYQWYSGSSPIPSATSGSYTTGLSGSYGCVVTNSCGSVTSNTAVLSIDSAPFITTQPISADVYFFTAVKFKVATTGTPAPTYQWYNSSGMIPNATDTSYTTGTTGSYYCVATNGCGSATSNTAKLTVNGTPTIRSIKDDKLIADNIWIETDAAIISAAWSDFFYIESDNRANGIRVQMTAHGFRSGMRANVIGQMATNSDMERYIAAISAVQNGTGSVKPMAIQMRDLGGGSIPGGQVGASDGAGVNNIGLLVSTWGFITNIGTTCLYISDGSNINDGNGDANGVRVICDPAGHSLGDFMIVTGISSCFKNSAGDIQRQILMR